MLFLLLLPLLLVPSAGHQELRREIASVKELVAGLQRTLDSLLEANSGKRIQYVESSLNSLTSKVTDISRKSQLLIEIHQDNAVRKDILQRISRNLEEINRKQVKSIDKKNDIELEKLDKLSENVQALFQVFGGMNRKLDELQTRVDRPTNDLKFFITKKIDSLTASTALLSDCIECDKESLKNVLHSFVRHPLENAVKKCSDLERNVERVLEAKWKEMMNSFVSVLHLKFESLSNQLERGHDIAPQDTPQEAKSPETPGRMFRKLWRKITEPITKVGDKIEAMELANERHHNETLAKLKELKKDSCVKHIQVIQNTTKETSQRLGNIESTQASVQKVCSQIISQIEHVQSTLSRGSQVGSLPGVTDALQQGYVGLNCADLQKHGTKRSGVYSIKPKEAADAFLVYCDLETEGGGWTVIQRRGDFGERQNFTQNWDAYKRGFGDPLQEFWIGNDYMHLLSTAEDVTLRVELQDFDDNTAHAQYTRFRVENESHQFRLSVGGYKGNATDSLSLHDAKMFSTYDRDNDEVASCCNCADTFKGGWWYYRCFEANLNGPYHTEPTENGYFLGIIWERWKGDYSLKSAEMKIRPLSFEDEIVDP